MQRPKRYRPVQGALEWAFRNECAELELPDTRDHDDRGFGFGMEYVMIQRAKLGGVQIDGGAPEFRESHEDAEAIAAVVSNIPDSIGGRRAAIMISELARSGITPDWMPGETPKIEPVEWHARKNVRQGKSVSIGVYIEDQHRPHPRNATVMVKYQKRHDILWTPCTWVMEQRTIDAARAEYSSWWRILDYIRDALQTGGILRENMVTDSMPPKCPWATRPGGSRPSAI